MLELNENIFQRLTYVSSSTVTVFKTTNEKETHEPGRSEAPWKVCRFYDTCY